MKPSQKIEGFRAREIVRQNKLSASYGIQQLKRIPAAIKKLSILEFLIVSCTFFSIFFLFVPGKEMVGYWAMPGCLLTLLVWVWFQNKGETRIVPIILIAVLMPLGLHVLIGLLQVVHRFYEVAFIGAFEPPNFRLHVSIGVKNLSIAASLFAVVGHYIADNCVNYRKIGRVFIVFSLFLIGFLNSLMGIICYCGFLIVRFIVKFNDEKMIDANKKKTILNSALLGLVALAIAFQFSGGEERLRLMQSSVIAAINKDNSSAWIDESRFAAEFCQGPHSECSVNASIYYRLSWAIFGLQTMLENPLGLGYVEKPLWYALSIKYPFASTYFNDDFHSEILSFGVRFGFLGLVVLLVLFGFIYLYLFNMAGHRRGTLAQLALGFLTVISIRLLGDSVGWEIFVALLLALVLPIIAINFEGLLGRLNGR